MSRPLAVGIDPGTGVNSGLGIAIVDVETGRVLLCTSVWPTQVGRKIQAWQRIRELVEAIRLGLELVEENIGSIHIESFVMRGRSGETLARLVGGIITIVPKGATFVEVANTRVKKIIGGSGSDDKKTVAMALKKFYPKDVTLIEGLIRKEDFDALDALAIVTAGLKGNE